MGNILTYIKNKTDTFETSPFNCVDALILSWLSYFCYPDCIKEGKSVALKDVKDCGLLPDKEMYYATFNPRTSKRFFNLLSISPRFMNIEFSDFIIESDDVEEKQFAAVCIKIYENKYFISFRGTDQSFTGWKEDFNLAYSCPVPSQRSAEQYLRAEMHKYPDGEFYPGGHSKGGNIAVYAAINAGEEMQSRIKNVYNFDGPGFLNDVYNQPEFKNIDTKILKYIPEASLIGMIFETRNTYRIVRSKSVSVMQHDPFTWEISGDDFHYLKCRTKGSVRLERALNDWVVELTPEERERMIKIVYDALNTLDTRDFNVVFKTFYRQIPALYREYKRLEQGDKTFFDGKIKRLKELLAEKRERQQNNK